MNFAVRAEELRITAANSLEDVSAELELDTAVTIESVTNAIEVEMEESFTEVDEWFLEQVRDLELYS